MRRNMYYEGMRGNLDKVNKGDLLGFRAYKGTLELNLPINYPIVFELYGGQDGIKGLVDSFNRARIDKFVYAQPSTSTTDDIALLYLMGYRICDVLDMKEVLGENSYKTCCHRGLVFKKSR